MNFRVAPPYVDSCALCDLPLAGDITKCRRGWVHRACFQDEQR